LEATGFRLEMVVKWYLSAVALVTTKTLVSRAGAGVSTVTPEGFRLFFRLGTAVARLSATGVETPLFKKLTSEPA
jgi:hypothetical protein